MQRKAADKVKPKAVADGVPVWCDHTKLIDPHTLKPDPANYNKHPVNQIAMMIKSITENGWQKPIVVDTKSGLIVTGHGETEAAIKAGLKLVPVDIRYFETEAKRRAWLIADNRFAQLADPDNIMLKDLLQDLDTGESDMESLGYSDEKLEEMMTQAFSGMKIDRSQGQLPDQRENVQYIPKARYLISIPLNEAMKLKDAIESCASIDHVTIIKGVT